MKCNKYNAKVKNRIAVDIVEDYNVYAEDENAAKNKAINCYMDDINWTYEHDNPEYLGEFEVKVEKEKVLYSFSINILQEITEVESIIVNILANDADEACERVNTFLDAEYPKRLSETVTLANTIYDIKR